MSSYDIQQICENGHQITDSYNINPGRRRDFCQDCGAATIISCKNCSSEILGATLAVIDDWVGVRRGSGSKTVVDRNASVPSYCHNCGKAYPWTENKIIAAIQILTEFGKLDSKEKETIEQDINNIAKDVPEAELSAMRVKRIWEKCGQIAYETIMEFASRTAAKILKNP